MHAHWLLKYDIAEAIERARVEHVRTPDEAAAFAQVNADDSTALVSGAPRNLKVAGDVAEIAVDGVLTLRPDFWSWLLYGANTTYESIIAAIAIAEADPTVKRLVFSVNSPGGHVHGLFDALAAIESSKKPKSVRACYACSAAYAIAAVAGPIEATNVAAEFGSIGVAASYFYDEAIIEITSTMAPDKRPDPSTDEGKAVIRRELDAIHELFAEAIASGRDTDVDTVNESFGRGAVLLAGEAKKRKMIDKISKPILRSITVTPDPSGSKKPGGSDDSGGAAPAAAVVDPPAPPGGGEPKKPASANQGGAPTKRSKMNEEEFKAQHPDLYAAVSGKFKEEGHKAGVTSERKRVMAHLKLGKASGANDVAFKHIESGVSTLDEEANADYQAASMNRRDIAAYQADGDAAAAALEGRKPTTSDGKSDKELLADAIDKLREGDAQ